MEKRGPGRPIAGTEKLTERLRLKISASLKAALTQYATNRGITEAEAGRRAIARMLEADQAEEEQPE